MVRGLYKATQGMLYESMRLDVISNNLANANTHGYKKGRIGINSSFETFYDAQVKLLLASEEAEEIYPLNPSENTYEPPTLMYTRYDIDYAEGTMRHTENPFDIAIQGNGFFCVQTPNGVRYTRDGAFTLNANGDLVTQAGYQVLGRNGPINIQGGEFEVDEKGGVFADKVQVDTLRTTDFPQPYQLTKIGDNLFEPSDANVREIFAADAKIMQGYIEESNVEIVREMVQMIESLRNYESYQKTIQSIDESIQQINDAGMV